MRILDTHVLIWWIEGNPRLTEAQRCELQMVSATDPAWVCDITLWELTLLQLGGKLVLSLDEFLDALERSSIVKILPISPAVARAYSRLPQSFHKDPADRLIVSTTIAHGATLLTADSAIIDSRLVPICR